MIKGAQQITFRVKNVLILRITNYRRIFVSMLDNLNQIFPTPRMSFNKWDIKTILNPILKITLFLKNYMMLIKDKRVNTYFNN